MHQGHVHSLLRWPRPYRKRACWRTCPRNECVNGPVSGGVCYVRQPGLCGEEEGRSPLSFLRRLVSSGGGGFHISGICLQEPRRLSQRVRLGSELFFPCEVVTIFCIDHNVENEKSWIQRGWRRGGRKDMVFVSEALKMFEFGPLREVTRARKNPTTTMWVDRVKNDDEGHEFVRNRVVISSLATRILVTTCVPRCLCSRQTRHNVHFSLELARAKRNRTRFKKTRQFPTRQRRRIARTTQSRWTTRQIKVMV